MTESEYYKHIGQVRLRYCQKKTYPKWKAIGSNMFLYYCNADFRSWVEEVHRIESNGLWMAGQTYNDTAHCFSDLQDALEYGEKLAFPKAQQHKFQMNESRRLKKELGKEAYESIRMHRKFHPEESGPCLLP